MVDIKAIDEMMMMIVIEVRDADGCGISFPSSPVETGEMRDALEAPPAS